MSRLTANQLRILRRAAEARVGWLPGEEVETTTAASLIRRQLLEPASKGRCPGLAITKAGRTAIGVQAANAPTKAPEPPTPKLTTAELPAPAAEAGAKLERVVALLRRDGGASLEELQAATGWQAHSVRGALSGALKKKRQLAVTSQKLAGRRVYMISNVGAAA